MRATMAWMSWRRMTPLYLLLRDMPVPMTLLLLYRNLLLRNRDLLMLLLYWHLEYENKKRIHIKVRVRRWT
jgi:hypothetical protein